MNQDVSKHSAPFNGNMKWLVICLSVAFLSVAVYLVSHHLYTGYELTRFSTEQISRLTSLKDDPELLKDYLITQFQGKIDSADVQSIHGLVHRNDTISNRLLADKMLKINSYFWLSGYIVYLELMFWSFWGVLLGNIIVLLSFSALHKKIESNYLVYNIAGLLYIPLCILILFFIASLLVHSSEEPVINICIAGIVFFISLLAVLIPIAKVVQSVKNNVEQAVTDISVSLILHPAGLVDDIKNEILENGFDQATISIQNIESGDFITTVLESNNHFVAMNVPTGIYIIRAMLSQRLSDHNMLSLFGEKKISINMQHQRIYLMIRKYDAEQ